jgi:hypothetical protein
MQPDVLAAPVTITPVKPGTRTTEFWLTLLVNGAAVAGGLAHVLPGPWAAVAAAVATAAYSLSRGLAKS